MSLGLLTINEQVVISGKWTTAASPAYQVLMSVPELAALMPRLTAVHQELLRTQKLPPPKEMTVVMAEGRALDERHDSLIRQIHASMLAAIEVAISNEEREDLLLLLDVLLPERLKATRGTYVSEAGATKLLSDRLTDAHRAMLKALPLSHDRTLLDLVEELLRVGHVLGEFEEKRMAVKEAHPSVGATAMTRARNAWLRFVRQFLGLAQLLELPDDQFETVFGELQSVAKKAKQRSKRRGATPEPPPEPAPFA